jgi:hypothetical protein
MPIGLVEEIKCKDSQSLSMRFLPEIVKNNLVLRSATWRVSKHGP